MSDNVNKVQWWMRRRLITEEKRWDVDERLTLATAG